MISKEEFMSQIVFNEALADELPYDEATLEVIIPLIKNNLHHLTTNQNEWFSKITIYIQKYNRISAKQLEILINMAYGAYLAENELQTKPTFISLKSNRQLSK